MIFDHRTYTVKPGTMPRQLELYEKHGKAPQERHLGPPALYGVTETGPINTYVHVWVYEDAARPLEEAGGDAGRSRLAELPEAQRRGGLSDRPGEQDPDAARHSSSSRAELRGRRRDRRGAPRSCGCGGRSPPALRARSAAGSRSGSAASPRARRARPRSIDSAQWSSTARERRLRRAAELLVAHHERRGAQLRVGLEAVGDVAVDVAPVARPALDLGAALPAGQDPLDRGGVAGVDRAAVEAELEMPDALQVTHRIRRGRRPPAQNSACCFISEAMCQRGSRTGTRSGRRGTARAGTRAG